MTTAILLAAGKSSRMGANVDKAFLSLVDKPVVAWSLLAFERCPDIDSIVLVVRKDQLLASKAVVKMFGISKAAKIVAGGAKRQESVAAGLAACDIDTRYVVVHDAARPLVKLWAVQTPQAFQMSELRAAHRALGKQEATDDCQAVELNGGTVKIVTNFRPNFKITTVEDLQAAGAMLK